MDILGRCQAACAQCQQSGGEAAPLETACRPKFCSWSEEEVDGGIDGGIGLDYGYMGRRPPQRAPGAERAPLFDPGTLVPVFAAAANPSAGSRGARQPRQPRLLDVYRLDEAPLGRGSYGEVIGATHRRTGVRRAVKSVAKAGLKRYVKDVGGFVRREVDILRRLDHPNIVRLYEAFEDESHIHLVLEICDGGDLLERVTVARERMPEASAAALLLQMLLAVQHVALRGVVHRDIKPENFLYARRECEREPHPPLKLIDFGLSRILDLTTGARLTPKIGTTEYMAPEAFTGRIKPALADRSDVWSLGVVLHVIFMGHFPSPRLADMTTEEYLSMPCWRRVSAQGKAFLGQMIRYEPERRPAVTAALKHPWLANVAAASEHAANWAQNLPKMVRAQAASPDLRRLGLVAAAREADERELRELAEVFRELEVACEGQVSRAALGRALTSPRAHVAALATELLASFDALDVDGSGSIDWSEMLAAVIGAGVSKLLGAATHGASNEAVCLRSFDTLSQGSGGISESSLAQLFLQGEPEGPAESPSGGTGGSFDSAGDPSKRRRASELGRLCREIEPDGVVSHTRYLAMMSGE